jgi:hypothetical protein
MKDRDTGESAGCGSLGRCWPGCCDDRVDARGADELLLARLVADGVELKCRRCRRTFTIPLTSSAWTRLSTRTNHSSVRQSLPTGKWKHSGRGKPADPRTI